MYQGSSSGWVQITYINQCKCKAPDKQVNSNLVYMYVYMYMLWIRSSSFFYEKTVWLFPLCCVTHYMHVYVLHLFLKLPSDVIAIVWLRYMYIPVHVHVCVPECYVPYRILVSMVTDQTRPFVDIPEPNIAILSWRQQMMSLVVETHTIYGTVVPQ